MKIFELLSGSPENDMSPMGQMGAPMAAPPVGAMPTQQDIGIAGANPQPGQQQQAGLGDMIGNYFTSGPKPIGGSQPPGAPPAPAATAATSSVARPGAPPAPAGPPQTSGGFRPFGNTGAGSTIDAVNGALTKPQPR